MEWIVGVLVALAVLNLFFAVYLTDEKNELKTELEDLRNELKFLHLTPQINEIATLQGHSNFVPYRDCNNVLFYVNGYYSFRLSLNEVESRLAELKSVLEKNCPKKCKKAAKK